MSKAARKRVAAYRKETLTASGHVYNDLARLADISYSMADKYMNGFRTSVGCDGAFKTLTGKSPLPTEAWVPKNKTDARALQTLGAS